MEKLLEQINDRIAAFQKDAYLQWFKGNKAAGRRARKAALELMALLKVPKGFPRSGPVDRIYGICLYLLSSCCRFVAFTKSEKKTGRKRPVLTS